VSGDSDYRYDAQDLAKLERFISSTENLLNSEGWKFFEYNVKASEKALVDIIVECSVPMDLVRAAGKLSTTRQLAQWPMKMLQQALADRQKLREAQQQQEKRDDRRKRKP